MTIIAPGLFFTADSSSELLQPRMLMGLSPFDYRNWEYQLDWVHQLLVSLLSLESAWPAQFLLEFVRSVEHFFGTVASASPKYYRKFLAPSCVHFYCANLVRYSSIVLFPKLRSVQQQLIKLRYLSHLSCNQRCAVHISKFELPS